MIKEKIENNIGIIYLDADEKLNALGTEAFRQIKEILLKWENDDNIKAILFDSLSDKGFSAGGDLKEIYNDFLENDQCKDKAGLFKEEFDLDKYVKNYKKPIISHWFNITMGGGVGLTINSDLIITDETVNWAMPETSLGFSPDVGVGYHLSKLPQDVGQYIGLLGISLQAPDLIKYGLADLFIKSSDYDTVIRKLFDLSTKVESDRLIDEFRKEVSKYEASIFETELNKNSSNIEKYFKFSSLEEIYNNLEKNKDDEFARKCLDELKSRDKFALTVQFEKYFKGKELSVEETLDLDLRIIEHAIKTKSINEGIRAKIIDKDEKANWPFKTFDEVSMNEVKNLLDID